VAATKTLRTIQASATNTAGSTTTGTAVDLTTRYGGVITALITNGGTGPTIGCDHVVEVSGDNSAWKEYSRQTAGVTASGVYPFVVEIPPGVMYVRSKFQNNTGQSVSVEAYLEELTTI
jgi:hypothetical protein